MSKPKKKRLILILILAGVVLAGFFLPRMFSLEDAFPLRRTESAEVRVGEITTTVTGTGNLSMRTGYELSIPQGLEVDEVFVRTGDIVRAGDPLAAFTPISIQTRLAAVQTALYELEQEMQDTQDNTAASTITAPLPGRVERIYAAAHDSVSAVVAAQGALLVLLPDGADVPLAVLGTSGTVDAVHVAAGDAVRRGERLFTLRDADNSANYQTLLHEHAQKTAQLLTLLRLTNTPILYAEFDGIVEQVFIGDEARGNTMPNMPAAPPMGQVPGGMFGGFMRNDHGSADVATSSITRLTQTEPSTENPTAITSLAALQIAAPMIGQVPQTAVTAPGYSGTVTWSPATPVFLPSTVYRAAVRLTANAGYYFDNVIVAELEALSAADVALTDDTLIFTLTYPETPGMELPGGGGGDVQMPPNMTMPPGWENMMPNMTLPPGFGLPSGMPGDFTMPGIGSPPNMDTITAFSIAPADEMQLTILVDQLDILRIGTDMRVTILLDALPDEPVAGAISRISTIGQTTSGGATRYAVEITARRTEQMLPGMSASAVITIDEIANILLIPVEALQEDGARTFVYTALDGSNPAAPTDVTAGASDGLYVQIVSGLSQGDTVYYTVSTQIDRFGGPWGPPGRMPGN